MKIYQYVNFGLQAMYRKLVESNNPEAAGILLGRSRERYKRRDKQQEDEYNRYNNERLKDTAKRGTFNPFYAERPYKMPYLKNPLEMINEDTKTKYPKNWDRHMWREGQDKGKQQIADERGPIITPEKPLWN